MSGRRLRGAVAETWCSLVVPKADVCSAASRSHPSPTLAVFLTPPEQCSS